MKKSGFLHLCAGGMLLLEYVLCRYVFFGIHGMKEWPTILLLFGLLVLCASFLLKGKRIPAFTALGYLAGFVLGVIFQTDGVDPGGGRTNDLWLIWGAVFLCVVGGSVVWELLKARRR